MKKTVHMIMIILACVMVTACVKQPETVHTGPVWDDDPVNTNPVSTTVSTPGEEQLNIDNPVEEKEDPLAMLEVSEEFAKEEGLLCLYRNDKLYSLGPKYISEDGKYILPTGFDDGKDYILNIDASEIIIQEGDQIRDYGDEYVNVYKSTFTGYTIPMFNYGEDIMIFDDEIDPTSNGVPKLKAAGAGITQFGVKENDSIVANNRHLENGKSYTVSWYSGMDYHEITMIANYRYYKIDSTPSYELKGTLSQSGYALIDIRDLPSGTYHINGRDLNTTIMGEEAFPITIP